MLGLNEMTGQHAHRSALLILSHHMDKNGRLGKETAARVGVAVDLFRKGEFDFIITSGWNYRSDCELKIGQAVAEDLLEMRGLEKEQVLVDVCSRDTVGDAYFIRKNIVRPKNIQSLTVVTSDYHKKRTKAIFEEFFLPKVKVEAVGASVAIANMDELLVHEENSIRAFHQTFENVDFADDNSVQDALTSKHPFYNGEVYRKLAPCK